MGDHLEVTLDPGTNFWTWSYVSINGRVMARAGEGYLRRTDCLSSMEHVLGGYVAEFQTGVENNKIGVLVRADNSILQIRSDAKPVKA